MRNLFATVSLVPLLAVRTVGHAQTAAPADAAAPAPAEGIIVTGTRVSGVKAADSAAPIELVGAAALKRVGQPDLISALEQSLPSFNAEQYGSDAAAMTLSANLRGLNPNDTLVLLDGKRRHGTSNLHIDPGPFIGAAAADLGLIPVASIDHIEVLTDGAAAQYGSDAVAGVINIITKKNTDAGSITGSLGQFYEGDGKTYDISLNKGFKIGDRGYVNVTVDDHYHGHTRQGTYDARFFDQSGNVTATGVAGAGIVGAPGYPYVNKIYGDTLSHVFDTLVNAGYDLTDNVQAYAQATYAHRSAQAYENYRSPTKVSATTAIADGINGAPTDVLNGVTPVVSGGRVYPFPNGFQPLEAVVENDFAFSGGLKGTVSGWNWDLSTTWGKDNNYVSTLDSANVDIYAETGTTPTNFYDGSWLTTEWTSNLDVTRDIDVGMASPLNVALGADFRRDTYEIRAGDPASFYKSSASSFAGYAPSDAGLHARKNVGAYVDLAVQPVSAWKVDVAGRFEHYTDFGSTVTGKFTTRYDFSPEIALRGTISNGFRAPTLAEEYYSGVNVAPGFEEVVLPSNGKAASQLGFAPLKAEKSMNYSAGLVLHPAPRVQVTIDAYQINLRHRIIGTGGIVENPNNAGAINQAIANAGKTIFSGVTYIELQTFTNGANTRTRGIDATANYASDFEGVAHVDWSLGLSYNTSKITEEGNLPASLLGGPIISQNSADYLTTANPKVKVILGAYITHDKFSLNLRETFYGSTQVHFSPDGTGQDAPVTLVKTPLTPITDIDLGYMVTRTIKFDIGANNLFSKRPPIIPYISGAGQADGNNVYNEPYNQSPYGINGGYYYAKFTWNF
jgi:iron complex outermembrane receptor protein